MSNNSAWIDPFAEPLSPVNRVFVEQSGKWSKVDLSSTEGYSHLVSAVLVDFAPAYLEDDRLVGLTLRFDNGSFVKAQTVADELIVDLA